MAGGEATSFLRDGWLTCGGGVATAFRFLPGSLGWKTSSTTVSIVVEARKLALVPRFWRDLPRAGADDFFVLLFGVSISPCNGVAFFTETDLPFRPAVLALGALTGVRSALIVDGVPSVEDKVEFCSGGTSSVGVEVRTGNSVTPVGRFVNFY